MNNIKIIKNLVYKNLLILKRPSRWQEYERYIRNIKKNGYTILSLEDWLANRRDYTGKIVILRHDVDLSPESALIMSRIEYTLGVVSTFYFRWNTLDLSIVNRIRDNGSHVGLHYETLTRYSYEHHLYSPEDINMDVLETCRKILKKEIACFKGIVGICNSLAAHGDRRAHLIGYTNDYLLKGQCYADYGILYNADDEEVHSCIDCWVSDGDGASTYWSAGISIQEALEANYKVILFNTHPHHWTKGSQIVTKRMIKNIKDFIKHPTYLSLGNPEVFAWNSYLSKYNHYSKLHRKAL